MFITPLLYPPYNGMFNLKKNISLRFLGEPIMKNEIKIDMGCL